MTITQTEIVKGSAQMRYVLHLADNALILAQRLGAWCGHGPILEQDIAITNVALDLFGQARMYFQYAAALHPNDYSEDDLAFLRDGNEFYNCLLVEQPNGDWAHTIVRQLFFDAYHVHLLHFLQQAEDKQLRAIAEKSIKEVKYHLRYSSEWTIRLGDGTDESHQRMQAAVDELWRFTGELFIPNAIDTEMKEAGIAPDLLHIHQQWQKYVADILSQATLNIPPADTFMQKGGKDGRHSELLGYILTEMQWMQRTYPNMQW